MYGITLIYFILPKPTVPVQISIIVTVQGVSEVLAQIEKYVLYESTY